VSQSAANFSVTMRRFSKIIFGFDGACVASMPIRKFMVDSATGPEFRSMHPNLRTSDLAAGVIGIIADRRLISGILHSRSGFSRMRLTQLTSVGRNVHDNGCVADCPGHHHNTIINLPNDLDKVMMFSGACAAREALRVFADCLTS
jgi:hypothetical protein